MDTTIFFGYMITSAACRWRIEKKRQIMFYTVYDRSVPGHIVSGSFEITLRRYKQGIMYLGTSNLDYVMPEKK